MADLDRIAAANGKNINSEDDTMAEVIYKMNAHLAHILIALQQFTEN